MNNHGVFTQMNLRKSLLSVTFAALVAVLYLGPSQAQAGAASNYMVNKLIDYILRQQAFTAPATVYMALSTTTSTPTACGTEAAYTGYARVAVSSSLTNWAGTQSAGSTGVSSGTSGTTSNNVAITFGAPTSGPTVVTGLCMFDASSGGNLLLQTPLTTSKTINNGDSAPSIAIAAFTWTIN